MVRPALFEAETPTTLDPEKDDAPEKAAAGETTRRAPVAIARTDFMLTSNRLLVVDNWTIFVVKAVAAKV